ncbi:MAG: OmpH family outer membrane protein [Candidatus Omnitrophota bacterium]
MRKRVASFILISGLLFLFLSVSFAEDLKIVIVDFLEVFNEYEKTKQYDQDLEKKKSAREKELEAKREEIENMQNKLSLLKENEQEKEKANIAEAVKSFKDMQREMLVDLQKERDEKMKLIVSDIEKTIGDYAKKNEYDLVVSKNAVLYSKETMDITSKILNIVNSKHDKISKTTIEKKTKKK